MANLTVAAGGQGVAGTVASLPSTATGSYGTAYSDNGNRAVAGKAAVRRAVARTASGSNASTVYSETQGLRFAYAGVEADSPALDATRANA